MAINPLQNASDGYLSCSAKKLLVIAVAGYLNFCAPVPSGQTSIPIKDKHQGGGKEYRSNDTRDRLLREDDEVLTIIKIWTQCQG